MEKFLIVGLGNPGEQYEKTKHNVGFMVIDKILNKLNIKLNQNKFNGYFTKVIIDQKEVFISKPLTYMNLSGKFVKDISNFFKIDFKNILVIYDDIYTEIGKIKIKKKGSSGGQNGIKNIIEHFGTEEIKRIKIGIGKPNDIKDLSNYVLSNFPKEKFFLLNNSLEKATDAAIEFLKKDFEKIISQYN